MFGPFYHAQFFFDDPTFYSYDEQGRERRDIGFLNDNRIRPDDFQYLPEYTVRTANLDDATLHKAIENIEKNWDMDWRLFGNNCQDFGNAVMQEYERLRSKGQ